MIYVIYVQSGREHDVVATLRDKNIIKHRRYSYQADRSGVWRLQVCLRCIRNISYWTSRRQCWIPTGAKMS